MALSTNNNFEENFPPPSTLRGNSPHSPTLSEQFPISPTLNSSFADIVRSSPSPRQNLIKKSAFSILDPQNVQPAKPFVRGTKHFSVIYTTNITNANNKTALHMALLEKFPNSPILDIAPKYTPSTYSIEDTLPSSESITEIINSGPLLINNVEIPPHMTSSSDNTIIKINLTKLPLMGYNDVVQVSIFIR
jgi:hypothetical protein